MPSSTISTDLVNHILRLKDAGKTSKEIAQALNLKRLQVAAILAHVQLKSAGPLEGAAEETAPPPMIEAQDVAQEPSPPTEEAIETSVEAEAENGIYVGDDTEYNDPLYWVPWNTRLCQNPHLMIIGESGSGKTYATQCLVAELAQAGIPSVIFDYGQGFELETLDRHFRKFSGPEEYLIGEKGLAINPVEIFPKCPGRGRDIGCPIPPAQIPTSGITA